MRIRMDKFIVNIIHRPEMVPEYAEKITGQGKGEDITRKDLLTESLDIFKTQQEIAHRNGLKTTIQMTYASLFNDGGGDRKRAS
jgi:proline dehydrogenase